VPSAKLHLIESIGFNPMARQTFLGSSVYIAPLSTRNSTVACFPVGPVTVPSTNTTPIFDHLLWLGLPAPEFQY
jgi:hypothetical protein